MKKISIVFTLFVLHVSSVLAFSTEFLMFRGNPERNLYGMGIMPENLEIEWRYPKEPMCAKSSAYHKTKKWCGAGWTGQTLVRNYIDKNGENSQEIIFGAYDKAFHFVDSSTGKDTRKPLKTGDIIKGSATLDPDGFPLLYGGSRDNIFRIISLDEKEAKVAWSMNANNVKGLWNNDWDSNPVIRDDYLFEGGENGWLYIVKLNRAYDEKGKVTVKPKIIWKEQSYDKAFLKELKDKEVGIENSIVFYGDKFYVANSGGRILGYDISNIENRVIKRVFDFWAGDDIDGTIVIDIDGFLYVSVEEERKNKRSREIGQLIKLNPENKENPIVWNKFLPGSKSLLGGIWATPAIKDDRLYVPTNRGNLLAVDTETGETVDSYFLGGHDWSSPIILKDRLMQATCSGEILTFDISNPNMLKKIDTYIFESGSCLEATPTVSGGEVYITSRDGYMYKLKGKKTIDKTK